MAYSLEVSTGFLLEQSQDISLNPTQTPGPGGNELVEGWGLSHHYSGVSAHWALPLTVHGGLLWKKQSNFEGHEAHLTLCSPASGRPDAETSCGDLTSSAGCPACPERLPQVSLIQVASLVNRQPEERPGIREWVAKRWTRGFWWCQWRSSETLAIAELSLGKAFQQCKSA